MEMQEKPVCIVSVTGTVLFPWQIDNLSSEFFGVVLKDKSGEDTFHIEFPNVECKNAFEQALTCFTNE